MVRLIDYVSTERQSEIFELEKKVKYYSRMGVFSYLISLITFFAIGILLHQWFGYRVFLIYGGGCTILLHFYMFVYYIDRTDLHKSRLGQLKAEEQKDGVIPK